MLIESYQLDMHRDWRYRSVDELADNIEIKIQIEICDSIQEAKLSTLSTGHSSIMILVSTIQKVTKMQ